VSEKEGDRHSGWTFEHLQRDNPEVTKLVLCPVSLGGRSDGRRSAKSND
jgi:hypothetical protein